MKASDFFVISLGEVVVELTLLIAAAWLGATWYARGVFGWVSALEVLLLVVAVVLVRTTMNFYKQKLR